MRFGCQNYFFLTMRFHCQKVHWSQSANPWKMQYVSHFSTISHFSELQILASISEPLCTHFDLIWLHNRSHYGVLAQFHQEHWSHYGDLAIFTYQKVLKRHSEYNVSGPSVLKHHSEYDLWGLNAFSQHFSYDKKNGVGLLRWMPWSLERNL